MTNRRSRISHSPKQVQKKRKKLIIISLLYLLCFISYLFAIFLLFRLDFMQIDSINIKGVTKMNTIEIEENIKLNLSDYYFKIIPKSNILFYPKSKIEADLLDSYKKIDSLNND